MTCRDCASFLSEYVGGELAPGVHAEFETHIAACPDCHVYLAQYRTTIHMSRTAFDEPPGVMPEALVNAIVQALKT